MSIISSPAKGKCRALASTLASPIKQVKAVKCGVVSPFKPSSSARASASTSTTPRSPFLGEAGESDYKEVKKYNYIPNYSPSLGLLYSDRILLRSNSL